LSQVLIFVYHVQALIKKYFQFHSGMDLVALLELSIVQT